MRMFAQECALPKRQTASRRIALCTRLILVGCRGLPTLANLHSKCCLHRVAMCLSMILQGQLSLKKWQTILSSPFIAAKNSFSLVRNWTSPCPFCNHCCFFSLCCFNCCSEHCSW